MVAQFVKCHTPDGSFALVATPDGVVASGWVDEPTQLMTLIHPSLRPSSITAHTAGHITDVVSEARQAVHQYYDGDLEAPSHIPTLTRGGPFVLAVWAALCRTRVGEQLSYSELARRAGNPRAVRAAASACARNPVALFVPCHRIIRSDGSLGGFGFGLAIKQSLLAREQTNTVSEGNMIGSAKL
jgi:O-6-methylguanine DNA methyltransferase